MRGVVCSFYLGLRISGKIIIPQITDHGVNYKVDCGESNMEIGFWGIIPGSGSFSCEESVDRYAGDEHQGIGTASWSGFFFGIIIGGRGVGLNFGVEIIWCVY